MANQRQTSCHHEASRSAHRIPDEAQREMQKQLTSSKQSTPSLIHHSPLCKICRFRETHQLELVQQHRPFRKQVA